MSNQFVINDFFDKNIKLNCNIHTRSYIISILSDYKSTSNDLSQESITLIYADARLKQDFSSFQRIGDWLFFTRTLFPDFLIRKASMDYFDTVGKLSYYSCYKLLKGQWKLYEELADQFEVLSDELKISFNSLKL